MINVFYPSGKSSKNQCQTNKSHKQKLIKVHRQLTFNKPSIKVTGAGDGRNIKISTRTEVKYDTRESKIIPQLALYNKRKQ